MGVNVELRIEELVLHGVRSADRHDVAHALEVELAQLFADPVVTAGLTSNRSALRVEATPLPLRTGATPASLGTALAHSVVAGIRR